MTKTICRDCKVEIRWVRPRWRKTALPIDVTEIASTDEALLVYTGGGHILKRKEDGEALTGYPCHFDTCVVRKAKKEATA